MTKAFADIAALVLRVTAGLIFLPHGWSKIATDGGPATFAGDMAATYGIPAVLGHLAAWSEVVGAVLLIAGFLTRLDALLLGGTMAVAAFVVQLPDALYGLPAGSIKFFEALRGIETPLAMLSICVALLLTGPGRISVDHLLGVETRVRGWFVRAPGQAQAQSL